MFDKSCRGKIKNAEIQAWRAELGMYAHHVQYRAGSKNAAADALSRVCDAIGCPGDPSGLHELWGVPVSLDFGTSFAVKTYLFQKKKSTRRVRSVPRAPL